MKPTEADMLRAGFRWDTLLRRWVRPRRERALVGWLDADALEGRDNVVRVPTVWKVDDARDDR